MTDFSNQSLNLGIETRPEFNRDSGVVLYRLEVFVTRAF